jgi:hypothetical protein
MTTTQAANPAQRTAYLVLGMHRSGTSAVTQLLALAGAQLPQNVMPGDEHNAKGYFEPWRIAIFNDERLRAGGAAWDDVFAYPFTPLARKDERVWLNRAMDLFQGEFGEAPHPLLKDPRVTVLLPFWRTALADLAVEARCVIPVRHPLAVAGSLARRNGFPPEKSVLLWSAYMLAAEAYSRDLPRVFVSYDALLADWRSEATRIEQAHGAALPKLTEKAGKAIDKFLTPDLRHNRGEGGLAELGWPGRLTEQVLDWFEAAAADRPHDAAVLEAATAELERRRGEFGPLVSPVTRDLDALRTEVRDLRAQLASEVAELRATMQRDREGLEAGWQADAQRWEAEGRRQEAEIQDLQRRWAELGQRLDQILAEG